MRDEHLWRWERLKIALLRACFDTLTFYMFKRLNHELRHFITCTEYHRCYVFVDALVKLTILLCDIIMFWKGKRTWVNAMGNA